MYEGALGEKHSCGAYETEIGTGLSPFKFFYTSINCCDKTEGGLRSSCGFWRHGNALKDRHNFYKRQGRENPEWTQAYFVKSPLGYKRRAMST